MDLSGIYPIVPTPFDETGALDLPSIETLAHFMVRQGVQGLAVLGVMGEAHKLGESEQQLVTATFRAALPADMALVVGVRSAGTDLAVAAASVAQNLGADALLVAPPPVQSDEVIFTYYQRIAAAVDIPLILHDYPPSTHILMSPPLIARLFAENNNIRYIKLEDPPTGPKIGRVQALVGSELGIFGALGGAYAFEELDRGAIGIMTGFAYPEYLVEIYRRYQQGESDAAASLFYDMLPLIRFEFQPGLGVSLRKHILVQRGVFQTAHVRHPGLQADAKTLTHLNRILDFLRGRGYEV